MSSGDVLRIAFANLGQHTMRSALTMIGIVFGVGAVIAMLAIGAGAEQQALATIEQLGVRNVLVRDRELKDKALEEVRTTSLGLSPRDALAIADAVPGVELVAPRLQIEPYVVLAGRRTASAELHGVSWRHAELTHLRLAEGRFLDARDESEHAQTAVVGEELRRDLFGFEPAVGQLLKVNDVWLEVIGVLAPGAAAAGSEGLAAVSGERAVYVPVTTAARVFDRPPLEAPLDELVVRLAPEADPHEVGELIRQLLDRLHAGAADFDLVVPEALLEQSRRTQRLFTAVMAAIAGISLLVGGIGIMNIMLASVLERTREIGVRRAVGARRRDILALFLTESFAISLLGAVVGVVVGVGIAWGVAASAEWPIVVTPISVVLAAGVAMAVGLASGIYPATRAAELDPIDALRYE